MAKQLNVNLAFNADTRQVKSQLQDLQNQLTKIMQVSTQKAGTMGITKELQEASQAAASLKAHLEQATNADTGKLDLGLLNKSLKDAGITLDQYRQKLQQAGPVGQQAFNSLASSILKAEIPLKQCNTLLSNFATTLKNTARWQISSSILHGFMGSLQSAFYYAKDLNESLNNIRIVTGYNTDQMAKFASEANKAAQALSTTTTEYTNASLIYYQQGLSDDEVKKRTDVTVKMANVTRESAEEVSQQMTAIWNNFDDGSKSLEYYSDVVTALGAATASSSAEIAQGLEKFAAVADTVGLSYEYATSALATVTATTRQSADVVGNAFKTLFARLEGLKLGETLDDGTDLNKYSKALNEVGVNIKDTNGDMKAMDQILDELGEKWKTLARDQQMALAQTVGGVRQYTQLIALMDQWDFFQENLGVARDSEGTLQKQAEIYAESWDAARDRVKAAAEDIYNELINDKFFIDLNNNFAKFLNLINDTIKGLGGLEGVLASLGFAISKIFEKDLSAGIDKFFYNLQDKQQVAANMRESVLNSLAKGGSDDADTATIYESLIGPQQALIDNAKNLTELEKKTAQYLIEQNEQRVANLNTLIQEKNEAEKNVNNIESQIQKQLLLVNATKEQRDTVKGAIENYKIATQSVVKLGTALNKAEEAFNAGDLEAFKNAFKNIDTSQFSEKIQQIFKEIDNGTANAELALAKLQDAFADPVKGLTENSFDLLADSLAEIDGLSQEQIDKILLTVSGAMDNLGDSSLKAANGMEAVEEQSTETSQVISEMGNKSISAGQAIMGLAQGLSSIAMAINAVKGIGSILDDEDLSTGEKVISIVTTLGMVIPSVIMGVQGFKTAIAGMPALSTAAGMGLLSLGAKFHFAGAEALIATGETYSFGTALYTVLWPLGLILAAIAAVVGIIYALVKAYNADADAAKEAAETAEELAKQYDEVKKSYDELKKSLEDYNSAKDALDKLIEGTQEWKEAIIELNNQVLELLDKYPQLAEYIKTTDKGILEITKEGQEELIKVQGQRIDSAYQAKLMSQIRQNTTQNKSNITNLGRDIQYKDLAKSKDADYNVSVGNNIVESVIQAINSQGSLFLQNTETLKEVVNVTDYEAKALLEHKKELISAANRIKENTKANEIYAEQLGHSLLKNSKYENSNFTDQLAVLVGKKAQELYDNEYFDKYKDKGFWGSFGAGKWDADIQQQYADLMGYGYVDNLGDNKGRYIVNGESQDISDAVARAALAEAEAKGEALKATESYAKALEDVQQKSNTSSGAVINAIAGITDGIGDMTQAEAKAFKEFDIDTLEEDTIAALEINKEELKKKKESAEEDWNNAIADIQSDLLSKANDIFNNLDLSDVTANGAAAIGKVLNRAVALGSEDTVKLIQDVLKGNNVNGQKFADVLSHIDWDTVTVNEFKTSLQELGYDFKGTDESLQGLIDSMSLAEHSVEDLTKQYAEVAKVINGLKQGDTISQEDYLKLGSAASEYFVMMMDGTYKLVGDAKEFYNTVQGQWIDKFRNSIDETSSKNRQLEKIQNYDFNNLSQVQASSTGENGSGGRGTYNTEAIKQQIELIETLNAGTEEQVTQIAKWREELEKGTIGQSIDDIANAVRECEGAFDNLDETIAQNNNNMRAMDIAIASSYTNFKDLRQALEDGLIGFEAFNTAAVNLDRVVDIEDLNSEELENFAEYIQDIADSTDDLADNMSNAASKIVAKSILKMNDGIDLLANNWEEWTSVLNDSTASAEEYAKAAAGMKDAMANLLDINKDFISSNFIKDNLEEIKLAAEGDAEAIDNLKSTLSKEVIAKILLDNADFIDNANEARSLYDDLVASIPDIKVGVELDGNDEFINSLQKLIDATGMTVDQVNALCDTLGFDVQYENTKVPTTYQVPLTKTEHTRIVDDWDDKGNPTHWTEEEKVVNSELVPFTGEYTAFAVATDGSAPKVKGATKKATGSSNNYSSSNKGGTKGPGGKSVKGAKKGKDADKKDKIDDKADRYYDINNAISKVNQELERQEQITKKLNTYQDHYAGKTLIASLQKQNALLKEKNGILDKQYENYKKLYEIQSQELGELKGKIGGNWNGNELQNYAELFQANVDKYNAVIDTYNKMSAEQQEKSGKQMVEDAKKSYDTYKEALDRYQTLYYNEMYDTENKLAEYRQQQLENQFKIIENNLKAWETEIQLKLDMTGLKRDWKAFMKEVETDFRKIYKNLTKASGFDVDIFGTHIEDAETRIKQIEDVEAEIRKMEASKDANGAVQISDDMMFGSISEAQEKLKELQKELVDVGNSLNDMYKQVWDNYIDGLEQAKDNFEDINKEIEHLTKELEYEKELIELIYGDKAYELMNKYYTTQQRNIENQIGSIRQQAQFWEEQFEKAFEMNKDKHNVNKDDMSTWTEDMRKAYDNMIEAQEKLNDLVIEGIKNLKDEYLNNVAKTISEMDKAMWGMDFDKVKEDWDFIQKRADEYLDDVEGAYKIQTLQNKINKSIAETTDLKAQQKLAKLREDEMKMLREKERLTQDDIDLAEARYQIALKEIALEDAQNSKTSMKLSRDTSGNWTYQYVADEEDTQSKQQELLDAYANLYETADNAYNHAMELAMQMYEEYQEKFRQISEDTTLSEEEKYQKLMELQDLYLPEIEAAFENAQIYQQETIYATAGVFQEVCEQDETAYTTLTEIQKSLVDSVRDHHLEDYEEIRSAIVDGTYPELKEAAEETFLETNENSHTAAAQVIDDWDKGSDSVKAALNDAFKAVVGYTKDFEKELELLEQISRKNITDPDGIVSDIEAIGNKMDEAANKTDEMADRATNDLDVLRDYVNDVESAWESMISKIQEAIDALQEYLQATEEAIDAQLELADAAAEARAAGADSPSINSGGGSGSESGSGSGSSGKGVAGEERTRRAVDDGYDWYADPNGARNTLGITQNGQLKYVIGYSGQNRDFTLLNWAKKRGYDSFFDTGGYTGEWEGESGKLAVLHSKELVLNASDTENMLSAINTIRDLSSLNESISQTIASSIGSLIVKAISAGGVNNINTTTSNDNSNNNTFNITAEFPNANDVQTIRDAILSLPNIASQYIHTN